MADLLLMSIKTKYANQIFEKTKIYEFRRKSIGDKNCNKKIYIYSSEEDKAIIGYIIVDKILKDNLDNILKLTNNVNNKDIIKYFDNCDTCYALHISETYKFSSPIKLKDIKFVVPQFYRYIKFQEQIYKELENRK